MGTLVFQATLGGQVNLTGPNTASTFTISVPAVTGTMITSGDTATVTSTMISGPVTTAKGGTGLSSFTANGLVYASSSSALATGSALVFDGTNLGVGVTPSAWTLGKALEVGQSGNAIWSPGSGDMRVMNNAYYGSGPAYKYGASSYATMYQMQNGQHQWHNAPSGTAGNAITFTQAMTLDASGKLGIGTTSPGYKLEVSGTQNNNDIVITNSTISSSLRMQMIDAYGSIFTTGSYPLTFGTNSSERARITSAGALGIGTTSPNATFQSQGPATTDGSMKFNSQVQSTDAYNTSPQSGMMAALKYNSAGDYAGMGGWSIGKENATSGDYSSYFAMHTRANGGAITERARIDSSGNFKSGTGGSGNTARVIVVSADSTASTNAVYVENSTPTRLFQVRSDGYFVTGAAANSPYNNTTGSVANVYVDSSGVLYRGTSSIKYKTNVQTATFGLEDVLKLRPVTYQSISEKDSQKTFGGLIAEEVDSVGLGIFVDYANDGTPDALHYASMVSLCIKAIQEQQTIIDSLKARLDAANL